MAAGYGMIGIGKTDYDADAISSFDNPVGFDLVLGFNSSPGIAFEIGMVQFGEASNGNSPESHVEAEVIVVSGLFKSNLDQDTEIFLQFGLNLWEMELTQDGTGLIAKDDGNDLFLGIGLSNRLNEKVSLGVRYNLYDFDGDRVKRLTFNAQYLFE
jgi:hypothetical protein